MPLRFDRFTLDERQRVLLRDGKIVRLTPKAFDLLELLVSRPNEVVSKAELVDRIWPDTFVSDASLAKLVFMVRKKLGDGPDGRPYVETIPKRGYRFVGTLGEASEAAPPPVMQQPKRQRAVVAAALALAIIASASAALWWWRSRAKTSRPERTYLVVMPFKAATGGDESLARGVGEFVTATLSTMQGISVMPPVMTEVKSKSDSHRLARELGANLVLQATVQRTGDRIGVACSLVSPDSKPQVGAASFKVEASDIFEIEERVAGNVASLLELNQSLRRNADPALATPERQQAYVRAIGLLSGQESREIDEAIALLEPLAKSGASRSVLVLTALGRAHLLRFNLNRDRPDIEAAESYAARAAAGDGGKQARVRALRGAIARARGDLRGAAAELQAALALEPEANDILLDLASVYNAMGLARKAEATYDTVIRIHPVCALCFHAYGQFYKTVGRLEDAAVMHRRAIALDPESAKFQSDLAADLMLLGRFRQARPVLERALTISRNSEAVSNLGYCEYLDGDFEAAARHFAEATERTPTDFLSWGNLGDALRLLPSRGHEANDAFARAIAIARGALQVNAGDVRVRANLGEYLAKHGDVAAADREIASALAGGDAQPDAADILFSAAAVAAVNGRKTEAVDLLQRAATAGMSPALFTADPQFISLRSEPQFRAMGPPRPSAVTASAAR
jgi:DNA-binding winged helix-turn-helix (wHTH) protein/tetratricopeptide (TPR) repeat protein/TolB-like protein